MPDETTILRSRHLLEEHDLTKAIFVEVRSLPEEKELLLKQGMIVDATIILPEFDQQCDAEPGPGDAAGRKGYTPYFGM